MGAVTRCLVVCAAPLGEVAHREQYTDFAPDIIIAADGGYLHCDQMGLVPDAILGDFDSAPLPDRPDIVVYPSHKDDTDCMLALREGIARGAGDFLLLGCTGGRLDHTLAAIQSLGWLQEQGARGSILDDSHLLTLLGDGDSLEVAYGCQYISLLSLSDSCEGVSISGVEYPLYTTPLQGASLSGLATKLSSNAVTLPSVAAGCLLLLYCRIGALKDEHRDCYHIKCRAGAPSTDGSLP